MAFVDVANSFASDIRVANGKQQDDSVPADHAAREAQVGKETRQPEHQGTLRNDTAGDVADDDPGRLDPAQLLHAAHDTHDELGQPGPDGQNGQPDKSL